MINTELTKIREEKNMKKSEFAGLLGITAMLLGRYESGKIQIPDELAKKIEELGNTTAVTEIEVKKETRKAVREAGKAVEEAAAEVKEAVEEKAAATEIEVKKNVRKSGRKAQSTAKKAAKTVKDAVRKAAGIPNIIIQSAVGGEISAEGIAKKVPQDTADVYVKVEENKLYYVLKNGESGSVDIW